MKYVRLLWDIVGSVLELRVPSMFPCCCDYMVSCVNPDIYATCMIHKSCAIYNYILVYMSWLRFQDDTTCTKPSKPETANVLTWTSVGSLGPPPPYTHRPCPRVYISLPVHVNHLNYVHSYNRLCDRKSLQIQPGSVLLLGSLVILSLKGNIYLDKPCRHYILYTLQQKSYNKFLMHTAIGNHNNEFGARFTTQKWTCTINMNKWIIFDCTILQKKYKH